MSTIKYPTSEICRSCLSNHHNLMVTIASLNVNTEMESLLKFFDLEESEGITTSLCDNCVTQLQNILIFKSQCESSKIYLEKALCDNLENKNDLPDFVSPDVKVNDFVDVEKSLKTERLDDTPEFGQIDNSSTQIPNDIKNEIDDTDEIFNTLEDDDRSMSPLSNDIKPENETASKDTSFKCDFCSKVFRSDSNLARHKYFTHGVVKNVFPCKNCSRIYSSKDDLDKHFLNRHETVCNVCNKKYKNNLILRRHKVQHQVDRPNNYCRICQKFYANRDSYSIHMKNYHTEVPKKKIICSECGRSVFDIAAHMANVHKSKELKCSYCEKTFKYKKTLLAHVDMMHEKSSNIQFLCQICGKVFKEKGALKRHTKAVHSDEKNYQCSFCEKKYKANYLKIEHEKIVHLNYKPHKCEHCTRSFSRKSILLNHVRTHTGEKPFVCSICSRAFGQEITLRTHRKLVHGIHMK